MSAPLSAQSAPLSALSQQASSRASESLVLSSREIRLTANDALARVERIARGLQNAGVRVLAIAADNSPDWVLTDLAAQRAGIPVVPVASFFSEEQARHVLADSGADAIAADEFGSAALMSLPTRFAGELTDTLTLLSIGSGAERPARPGLAAATAKISYTSGTTGEPKGVCLTQPVLDRVALGLRTATANAGIERHLCLLPLATLLENVAGVYAPMLAGAEVIVPSLAETGLAGAADLDCARLLRCIAEYEPHSVILLPQMLAGLVGAIEWGAQLPTSLGFAAVGGGVVGLPLLERADRAGLPVYEGYGLTECGSVVALNTPDARRKGSVGRPLPHSRIRIGDDSEVLVCGALMSGYLGDGRGRTGAIATGDIGYLDDDGFLFIEGRRKNVLITSYGRNVSPEWVEATLTGSESIAQAALFGDAMPWNIAVIVPSRRASIEDIECDIAQCNRRLPDYARVRHWILATETFSALAGTATPNGRLRRGAIERKYRHEIAACYAQTTKDSA